MVDIKKVMVQLNLNFTHTCRHISTYVRFFLHVSCVQKLHGMTHTYFAHNFGMRTHASEYTQHTRDAHHKLAQVE